MKALLEMVQKILKKNKNDKLIIVSQWTKLLEIIALRLPLVTSATFRLFTGKTPIIKRQV